MASLRCFGRPARRSASAWALLARYRPRCPVLLRASSRLTVDAGRPIRRAISRTGCFASRRHAISSRSANDNRYPDGCANDGTTPPTLQNQPCAVGRDTPDNRAASSTDNPARTCRQNSRCTRPDTGGRPILPINTTPSPSQALR